MEEAKEKGERLSVLDDFIKTLVRESLNPYGFQSVSDSIAYVNAIREKSRIRSDRAFLA